VKLETGRRGEEIAADYLLKHGYAIRERGRRDRLGEIDIIAEHDGSLVFVEVKTRTGDTPGGEPWEKITPSKLRRICRIGETYAAAVGLADRPLRVDVIGVTIDGDHVTTMHYEDVTRFMSAPKNRI